MAFLYPEPETQDSTGMQCVSCYNNNNTNCIEKLQECYKGEQCVRIIMELKNGKSWFLNRAQVETYQALIQVPS